MRAADFLTELFDRKSAFELEWDESFAPKELHAFAYDRQGRIIAISFVPFDTEYQTIDIEFTRGGSHDLTNYGDAERVLATVIEAIRVYLEKYNKPMFVLFSGKGDSRFKLYQRLVTKFASQYNYTQVPYDQLPADLKDTPGMPRDVFALMRTK